MDPVSGAIADNKIPVGIWGKSFFQFLTDNFEWFFDFLAGTMKAVLDGLTDILLIIPPIGLALAIAALAWYLQKSWKLAAGVALGLMFIINQGLWNETVETLVLVVAAAGASMAIGVPIGIGRWPLGAVPRTSCTWLVEVSAEEPPAKSRPLAIDASVLFLAGAGAALAGAGAAGC